MGRHRTFQSRANRDAAWRAGGKQGRRWSMRGQQLHPMYVEDYTGPERHDTGFGNTVYRTYFPVLYCLDD